MTGKSAAMMRPSSPITRPSSAATGRWMSPSDTGAICWLTSLHLGELSGSLTDVFEPDVHGEHAPVQLPRLRFLPLLFERPAQPVQDPQALRVARRGQLEPAPQDRFGHDVSTLFDETRSEEHTSELQSLAYLVCRLLLEKKKKNKKKKYT